MSAKFEVTLVYKGVYTYIVEAMDKDEALDSARSRWEDGDDGEKTGSEWEDIENLNATEMTSAKTEPS